MNINTKTLKSRLVFSYTLVCTVHKRLEIYLEVLTMAKDSSFDIVSKVELPEVTNAINIALKEIQNRYDFKGSKSDIKLEKVLVLTSDDEFKLEQVKDVLISKLVKRNVPIKNLDYGKVEAQLATLFANAQHFNKVSIKITRKN